MNSVCAPLAHSAERRSHDTEVVSAILIGSTFSITNKKLYVHLSIVGISNSQLKLNTYHSYNLTLSLKI